MAAEMSVTSNTIPFRFYGNPKPGSKPNTLNIPFLPFSPAINPSERKITLTICYVTEATRSQKITHIEVENMEGVTEHTNSSSVDVMEMVERKQAERSTGLIAAPTSCLAILSMVVLAVYFRYSWQMEGGDIPVAEMLVTFASSVASAVGMEFLSRWTHRVLWHASLWHIHKSHHQPREGCFEFNDVFAVINAAPAVALINFGFFHQGLLPGLCLGAGLGMTLLGMAYIIVHNGLAHRRFPVGLIANVPYFQRVAAAHQIHHSGKLKGVPYGLFLGPEELEGVRGGTEELEKEISRRIK